jgi:hypothetical protein
MDWNLLLNENKAMRERYYSNVLSNKDKTFQKETRYKAKRKK